MKKTIAMLVALAMCACVFAVEDKPEPATEVKKAPAMELTEGLKPLSWYVGNWNVEEHVKPMDFTRFKEANGTFEIMPALRGHALVGKLNAESEVGPFEAMYTISADPRHDNQIHVLWSDSLGNAIKMENARVEGNQFKFEMTLKHKDQELPLRMTHTRVDDDHISFNAEVNKDGNWEKFVEGSFTRKKAAQPVKFELDIEVEEGN